MTHPLKVFLSHAHADANAVRSLYDRLVADGVDAWLDKEKLIPGQDWEREIRKAVREADVVVVCLSKQFNQRGYRQKEVRIALDEAEMMPEGEIFIIPARLEECENLDSLRKWQWVDLFENDGYEKLMAALRLRAQNIGIRLQPETSEHKEPFVVNKSEAEAVNKQPSQQTSRSKRKSIKTEYIVALIGAIATIIAAILGSPLIEKLTNAPLVPAPTIIVEPSVTPLTAKTSVPTLTPQSPTFSQTPLSPSEGFSDTDPAGNTTPMQFVDAGEFTMGSNTSSYTEERPAHTVYLDAYYIDTYEVTNARYKACVDAGVCQPPQETSSATRTDYYGNPDFADYPVIYVDWEMAVTYCEWRSGQLPSEAQWEKAARGTDGRSYPWGEGIDATRANYGYNIGDTTAVGNYKANKSPYGVYDMTGNVWEWVADWYSGTYYQTSPASNPTGPESGQYHGLRGGSWTDAEEFVRTFTRGWDQLEYFENVGFGFRCVKNTLPE